MASPPRKPSATSPTYPQHASLPSMHNPRKRASLPLNQSSHQSSSKRRRADSVAGSATSSAHPLRQTSFPPDEAASAIYSQRSPSMVSDDTGTVGDGVRRTKGRKGGRKSKKEQAEAAAISATSTRQPHHGRSTVDDAGDGDDEEDDDGDDGLGDDMEEVDKAAERKNLSILVDAFDADQAERYETFRRVKLKKETVRKIANFTLAQSVPAPIVTIVNGYTKTFIGTLIERARLVQQEWSRTESPQVAATRKSKPCVQPPLTGGMEAAIKEEQSDENRVDSIESAASRPPLDESAEPIEAAVKSEISPLLPDHFREALRRYRRDGESCATGLTGVSTKLGIPGIKAARLQGRPLFR